MTPTSQLRYVERKIEVPYQFEFGTTLTTTKTVRILQQWWESVDQPHAGEWRDVPIEQE